MNDDIIAAFNEAIFDTDRNRAMQIIHDAEQNGLSPEEIVFKIVVPSIHQMMKSVSESKKTNIAQHFIATQIASDVTDEMIPKFRTKPETIGCVVIGTSVGDMHGLGKRIVIGCLKALMIDVVDLGLNVSPERFVDEAIAHNAEVIGISSMMVHTARGENGCLKVRKILHEQRLEKKIKIAVGGAPYRFDPNLYKVVQADAWAEDGVAAGNIITELINEVRQ